MGRGREMLVAMGPEHAATGPVVALRLVAFAAAVERLLDTAPDRGSLATADAAAAAEANAVSAKSAAHVSCAPEPAAGSAVLGVAAVVSAESAPASAVAVAVALVAVVELAVPTQRQAYLSSPGSAYPYPELAESGSLWPEHASSPPPPPNLSSSGLLLHSPVWPAVAPPASWQRLCPR